MAVYPGSETETHVPLDLLTAAVAAIFASCGMGRTDAALLADSLATADLRGIHSHGVLRVPDYVAKLTSEGVDPRGTPRVVTDAGAALVIDGGNSMGQIGLSFAMDRAIARAADTNLALATVGGSNHCGALDYFAMRALDHDMIGVCGTNALPTMAPWGGRARIVGINPLAIAIPGGAQGPFVFDSAFGQTAHGKIRVHAQKGAPIPADWAFDSTGRPTTDAVAALDGLIRPIGGHKGVGLGMAVGMLSSLLSGAAYGSALGSLTDGPRAGADGHFALVINVAGFTAPDLFKNQVDAILTEIRDSAPAPDTTRLFTPGEMEADFAAVRRRGGIPLNDQTLDGLLAAASAAGADIGVLADTIAAARGGR